MAQDRVGWIGLGSMGIGMSKNLQRHLSATNSLPLTYTNRTLARGEELEALGAKPVATVEEVTKSSDIIFSCVSNDEVLKNTISQILASGDIKGKTIVDCSTVHPDTSVSIAEDVAKAGAEFVAAPVFGAAPMAEAAKLIFVTAGPTSATDRIARYIVPVMGRMVIPMGTEVSKSSLLKIAGNICVISFMEVVSEAHVFAEKTGLGSSVLESMIGEMFGPVLLSYSKRLTTGIYAPEPRGKAGFGVELAMKDARHALKCGADAGVPLEVSALALRNMEKAFKTVGQSETGLGRPLDSSSMYGTIRESAGLDFFTDLCKERDAKLEK